MIPAGLAGLDFQALHERGLLLLLVLLRKFGFLSARHGRPEKNTDPTGVLERSTERQRAAQNFR